MSSLDYSATGRLNTTCSASRGSLSTTQRFPFSQRQQLHGDTTVNLKLKNSPIYKNHCSRP